MTEQTSPRVDAFVDRAKKWRNETVELRRIMLECGLAEQLKWGKPCYASEGSNIAIIQGFSDHCSLMFFKGALLEDPEERLRRPGPNSHAARRLDFTDVEQVKALEGAIEDYVAQAVRAEEEGLEIERETLPEPRPAELQEKLDADPNLKAAFEGLTPGRQRAYILHFSSAKQSSTRTSRVEKAIPRILEGKGRND